MLRLKNAKSFASLSALLKRKRLPKSPLQNRLMMKMMTMKLIPKITQDGEVSHMKK